MYMHDPNYYINMYCIGKHCKSLMHIIYGISLFIYLLNIFILVSQLQKNCILPWRPVDKIYIPLIAKQDIL